MLYYGGFSNGCPFQPGQPCPNNFTPIVAPTHIKGTIDKVTHALDLNFTYDKANMTFTVTCPIVGTKGGSHVIDVASLGVTAVNFPRQGGFKVFPALGGEFTVIVNQEEPQ